MKSKADKRKEQGVRWRWAGAICLLLITAIMTFTVSTVHAAQANIAWDPPTTTTAGLGGYKLYIGNAPGVYSQSLDVGSATSYSLANLSDGTTYYITVASYDASGLEGIKATEISKAFPMRYTLTATSQTGGAINPVGVTGNRAISGTSVITSVTVDQGTNLSFSIVPDTGYVISDVKADGVSVGAVSSYTFNTISSDHTLSATFSAQSAPVTYTINASAGTGGGISPTGTLTLNSGASQAFTIAAAAGYRVADVKIDGASVGAVTSYSFANLSANHTISATFAQTPSSAVFAANCGGGAYTDGTGKVYQADAKFLGGTASTTSAAIGGTSDQPLYQSVRVGNSTYKIPVTNGNYLVTLKFAENIETAAGKRVFNIKMEGVTVVSNLDVFAKAGKNRAYDITVPIAVNDRELKIAFISKIGSAMISAISVAAQ